jgi:NAD(P)-dependent dehydrogenase (short-subunit alcohol dehydrogenase family)
MKQAVVTGATSGIGEAIARRLAATGLSVTLVGRSDERLRQARDRIDRTVPGAQLDVARADLAVLADVRKLADRIEPDIVVSNAAVIVPPDERTSEGLPRLLATNHLAPYLLLRTLAERARPARFVVVGASPGALARAPVDFDDLPGEHVRAATPSFQSFVAYGRTKNMNAMFVYALARRAAAGITVNGAHPGIIRGTGLGKETRGALKLFGALISPFRPGPDAGADTPSWLATAPDVEGVTGRFYVDRKEVPTAPHTTDVARCDRLWDESAKLCGL